MIHVRTEVYSGEIKQESERDDIKSTGIETESEVQVWAPAGLKPGPM